MVVMTKTCGLIVFILSATLFLFFIANYKFFSTTQDDIVDSQANETLRNYDDRSTNETITSTKAPIGEQSKTAHGIFVTSLPDKQETNHTPMGSNKSETTLETKSGDGCESDQANVTISTSEFFDIDYTIKTFQEAMSDKSSISLSHYLNGFRELMKFFHSLGTVFVFVTSDLETKIRILDNYRNVEKGCNPAYEAIQTAINYEMKENLLQDTKRQSGARTILRLHRALEFLSFMMLNLSKLKPEDETVPAVREAYSNTLANHHPWTIRTIASIAMRTLPQKKNLVESVLGKENSRNETLNNEKMLQLANTTLNLFNVVDKYFEEHNLKNLP